MSKVCATYHVVFNTYCRRPTITDEYCRELYNYIYGVLKNYNCVVYRINGTENHVHILFELNPQVALATVIKNLKQGSSHWLKMTPKFPFFESWAKEYFAFAISVSHRDAVIQYIKNQKEHHRKLSFEEELKIIFQEWQIEWDERVLR